MTGVPLAATTAPPVADLVLEGGGVKGIGLVGAVEALAAAGFTFARVAGTSAGAVVGAVVAAMQQRDEPLARLEDIALSLDYRRFRDRGRVAGAVDRLPGLLGHPLGHLVDALAVLLEGGAYEGDYLHDWVRGVLAEFDVHTFGDLRVVDPDGDGHVHHSYRLVVVASDVSRKRLAHLPWDYGVYGLDPDEQPVSDAVRASASIPYFFEPVQLTGPRGTATLVDGGLLSNYPIGIFDRLDERVPRWPTIGVRLATPAPEDQPVHPVEDPVRLGIALVETAIEGCQAAHLLDPCNIARSVYVDAEDVGTVDFDLTEDQQRMLLDRGGRAARAFLRDWDLDGWLRKCRETEVRDR